MPRGTHRTGRKYCCMTCPYCGFVLNAPDERSFNARIKLHMTKNHPGQTLESDRCQLHVKQQPTRDQVNEYIHQWMAQYDTPRVM